MAAGWAHTCARFDNGALPTIVETLRTHTPGSYIVQLLGKLASTWHWFEKPNNTSFYFYRLEVGPWSQTKKMLKLR